MTAPTEQATPSGTDKDAIKSVMQDTLMQQVQTLLKFTATEGLRLQIPETDIQIIAGPECWIASQIADAATNSCAQREENNKNGATQAQKAAPATDLHDAIMNLPCKRDDASFLNKASRELYKEGHRDARHAAAELALAHPATAVEPVAIPAGYALVPVEPTPEMLKAFPGHCWRYNAGERADAVAKAAYGAVLAAAPSHAAEGGATSELPAILFDGFAVYAELTRHLGKQHCFSPDAVSATLDAVVRLMRKERGAAPSYWISQRKMIERAIVGLRDGWATRKDADDALAALGSGWAAPSEQLAAPEQAGTDDGDLMLWLSDDTEMYANGPDDFANEYASNCMSVGEEAEIKVDCAHRLPSRTMRIALVEKPGDQDDYEVVWKWADSPAATPTEAQGAARDAVPDRKVILLKAAHELLGKQRDTSEVINLLAETVFYDGTDCDGLCLLDDIEIALEESAASNGQGTTSSSEKRDV